MYRKEKRIPTLIGFFIVIAGLASAIYFDNSIKQLSSKAQESTKPQDIHFTNITDNSMTISWLTNIPTTGIVNVTGGNNTMVLLDDLDSDDVPRPRVTHYITIKNLKEDTLYKIKINSGSKSCINDAVCPTLTQKTGVKLGDLLDLPPAHGKIITSEKKGVSEAIVYLLIGKNMPLSTRVDSRGMWVIPLNNIRSQDFLSRPEIQDMDTIQISAKSTLKDTTSAITDIKSIINNQTIPNMEIGKSYNFTDLISKKEILAQMDNQSVLGESIANQLTDNLSESSKGYSPITILFPKKDSDATTDKQPRIRGMAKPGSTLLITVKSSPQTGKVTVAKDGTWAFRPTNELSPGIHYLTVQGYDAFGKLVTVTRKFFVLKSGQAVLGESTPSASLTPTETPLSPTPTTVSPTPLLSPLPTPTITLAAPSPTVDTTPQPTTTIIPPKSGNTSLTMLLAGSGVTLLLLGVKLLLFP